MAWQDRCPSDRPRMTPEPGRSRSTREQLAGAHRINRLGRDAALTLGVGVKWLCQCGREPLRPSHTIAARAPGRVRPTRLPMAWQDRCHPCTHLPILLLSPHGIAAEHASRASSPAPASPLPGRLTIRQSGSATGRRSVARRPAIAGCQPVRRQQPGPPRRPVRRCDAEPAAQAQPAPDRSEQSQPPCRAPSLPPDPGAQRITEQNNWLAIYKTGH